MRIQKLIFTFCFLGLLVVSNQRRGSSDDGITVTHPSVFHEEYSDYKSTIQGAEDDHLFGFKYSKPLDIERTSRPGRPVFGDTSDSSTSSSDTSDLTDASETSDSDVKNNVFEQVSQKAKNLEEKAFNEIDKQRRIAKIHAKKNWEALKAKILREAEATNRSAEEIKTQLRNAKSEVKEAWREFSQKARNGSAAIENLLPHTDDESFIKRSESKRPFRRGQRGPRRGRPVFDISESSSSSDSSDLTDASDNDVRSNAFENISRKAKDFEGKARYEIEKQRKLAKLQARKYWQALKHKVISEANATNLSAEEIKSQLRSARRDARQKWNDLKWKVRNGNDILDELRESYGDLNPHTNNRKGNTEPVLENDTDYYRDRLNV